MALYTIRLLLLLLSGDHLGLNRSVVPPGFSRVCVCIVLYYGHLILLYIIILFSLAISMKYTNVTDGQTLVDSNDCAYA